MNARLIRVSALLALLPLQMHGAEAASVQSVQWQTIPLIRNKVLTSKLQVPRTASAADRDWMILEITNRTTKPLSIEQTWFGLEAERRDLVTNKAVCSGSLGPGSVFHGEIAPGGVVRVSSKIWPWISAGLGRPPVSGLKINASLQLRFTTAEDHFVSPSRSFSFDWTCPDARGITGMKARMKELLRDPNIALDCELPVFFEYPAVTAELTAGELLDALKRCGKSGDRRHAIARELGRRFADDPDLIAYVSGELAQHNVGDVLVGGIWNPAFATQLVDDFEKSGSPSSLHILGMHRGDWAANTQVVARLSAALLKHRPLLAAHESELEKKDLPAWCDAARDAAVVGDTGLIKFLAPALDDTRTPVHPDEDKMANLPDRRRVCDHALEAIAAVLRISLDQEYGVRRGLAGLEPVANCNRAIADMKKRLSKPDSKPPLRQEIEPAAHPPAK